MKVPEGLTLVKEKRLPKGLTMVTEPPITGSNLQREYEKAYQPSFDDPAKEMTEETIKAYKPSSMELNFERFIDNNVPELRELYPTRDLSDQLALIGVAGAKRGLEALYWVFRRVIETPVSEVGTAIQEGSLDKESFARAGRSLALWRKLHDDPKGYRDLWGNYFKAVTGEEAPDWYLTMSSVGTAVGLGVGLKKGVSKLIPKVKEGAKIAVTRKTTPAEHHAIQKRIGEPTAAAIQKAGVDVKALPDKGFILKTKDGRVFTFNEDAAKIIKGQEIRVPKGLKPKHLTSKSLPAPKPYPTKPVTPVKPVKPVTPTKPVVKPKPQELTKRLEVIKDKYKRPETIARAEVKAVQTELISIIKDSGITPKDKAKFISSIKNIQTKKQFDDNLREIGNRIEKYQISTEKRDISKGIKKELKGVKPLKVGVRKVAKFDYETNKTLRGLKKDYSLTKAKAQEVLESLQPTTESELIKTRLLSLKANGTEASLEIHQKVLDDIKRIKELGRKAKDEADLLKRINREEKVESALKGIQAVKEPGKALGIARDAYLQGFGNTGSMLNAIGGKSFAETYDPEMQESARNTAIYQKTRDVSNKIAKIYDEKNLIRAFERLAEVKFQLTDNTGLTQEINKTQLIDIYNSIKNKAIRQRYYDAFGQEQIESLLQNLNPEDMEVANLLQEEVQAYRQVMNERHIEITGRDLGMVENYWPATSEYQPSVYDDIRIQGETPSALKERARGKVIPRPVNAWLKAQKHIAEAEHTKHLSREYETLKRLITDRRVKHNLKQKFGDKIYNTLQNQLEGISLHQQSSMIDAVSGLIGKGISNWVAAKIASPTVFARQLTSATFYTEHMPVGDWIGGYLKGVSSPQKTFDYMWKNAPWLEARYHRGYKEALSRALDDSSKISSLKGSWIKGVTAMARAGDVSAIVYGGFPYVKHLLAQGKTLKQAMKSLEKVSLKAQQSGLRSSLSEFQKSDNPIAQLFFAFKNTPSQFLRKMADATISLGNKDIPFEHWARVMAIYGILAPLLYALAGYATVESLRRVARALTGEPQDEIEPDELLDNVIISIATNPVNAIPILDGIWNYSLRKAMDKRAYNVINMPMLNDLEVAMRKATKKEPTVKDFFEAIGTAVEVSTGAPVHSVNRIYKYFEPKPRKRSSY